MAQPRSALRRLRTLRPAHAKLALAAGFDVTGLNAALLAAQARLGGPWARALNYHDVPPACAGAFEAQLRHYAEHFQPVGKAELLDLHAGRWPHAKPGLLLSFDDGLRSHADVVAPLLEKYGFTGWFMVPTEFVETAPQEQAAYARRHAIQADGRDYPDPRIAMSWEDLCRLDTRHEICCHTRSHRRLGPTSSREELEVEIVGAKERLEAGLHHEVDGFAWVGGEEWAYSAEAARVIREAGFRFGFMTNNARIRPGADLLQIQRTNVEASFPPSLMRFSLSGFYDLMYAPKRGRVNRLTA